MKRSENVGLVVMGGAAFAATFAAGMAYFAGRSRAMRGSRKRRRRPARRAPTARRTAKPARRGFTYYLFPRWGRRLERSCARAETQVESAALTSNPRASTPSASPSGTTRGGFGTTAQNASFRAVRRRLDSLHAANRLRRAAGLERQGRRGRLRVPHHRGRALLGRARLLRVHAEGDRGATSRRRPPNSTRCAANWSRARSRDERMLQGAAHPRAVLDLHRGKLEARRPEPLWPLRFFLRRAGAREAARIQCRHADFGVRDRGVPVDVAGGREGARDRRRRMPTSTIRCTSG